ncbi:MAG: Gfo/Idh/MocA family oxidoreductase [Acidobacteria bacterium]|nr:Gfo/Idh/MocA family oxidoreductase [Acidobacteriota bacterium]
MKRIGMGLVGAGFIGPHHLDAVRRLGFVEVVAVADSTDAAARQKADSLGVPKSYGSYDALIADPDIHVVHNATPNFLHHPVNMAVIRAGKHIISDKPLAMTSAQARELLDAATAAGVVHAVTFNYRGNPLVQQARTMIAKGEIGPPRFVTGQYLQDWLLFDTDYSWRLEPDKGGESSAMGDIGSHWCDLAQHVTGLKITEVLADLTTVIPQRKRPVGGRQAFTAASADEVLESVDIAVEDLCSVLVRFEHGCKGTFTVGQICAGHKNDLVLEVCGGQASVRWHQERQNDLWIGHRDRGNVVLQKDPSLLDPDVQKYARLPGGHQEAWTDAFRNVLRDIYEHIAAGRPMRERPPAFASFEDGWRANAIIDAVLASHRSGSVWTKVATL